MKWWFYEERSTFWRINHHLIRIRLNFNLSKLQIFDWIRQIESKIIKFPILSYRTHFSDLESLGFMVILHHNCVKIPEYLRLKQINSPRSALYGILLYFLPFPLINCDESFKNVKNQWFSIQNIWNFPAKQPLHQFLMQMISKFVHLIILFFNATIDMLKQKWRKILHSIQLKPCGEFKLNFSKIHCRCK